MIKHFSSRTFCSISLLKGLNFLIGLGKGNPNLQYSLLLRQLKIGRTLYLDVFWFVFRSFSRQNNLPQIIIRKSCLKYQIEVFSVVIRTKIKDFQKVFRVENVFLAFVSKARKASE